MASSPLAHQQYKLEVADAECHQQRPGEGAELHIAGLASRLRGEGGNRLLRFQPDDDEAPH